jgi:type IV pilus assembly protein PilE
MSKSSMGVTLIELLIVVVIVGILAAVAYPNYRDHVTRAKRTEAKAALLQIATNQERHYLNNNQYTTDLTNLGFPVADNYLTDSEAYIVRVTAANANFYTAQAVYQQGGAEDTRCNTFTINATGDKTSSPNADCWTSTR